MMRLRGFTLIELLVTVAIIATLASIALPLAEIAAQRTRETDLRRALREIRDALDAYKRASDEGRIVRASDQSGYPPSLASLVEGVPDARSPAGAKLYFLRRVPADPMHESGWGLRSYASPPDAPQAGRDVFDVYSLNERPGLNGVPYRLW